MYYQPDCHRDKGRNPTWVSALLRRRDPFPNSPHETSHCFFGAHLISPLNERLFRPPLTPPNSGGETAIAVITPLNERLFRPPLTPPRSSFARLLPKGRKNSGWETAIAVMEGQGGRSHIAVVEAEKTAVILSAHYPQYLWLAAGGLTELTPQKLFPLRHHRIVLFPDTDTDQTAYNRWYSVAQDAHRQYGLDITVSSLLERRATKEQKERKIDLIDFIF